MLYQKRVCDFCGKKVTNKYSKMKDIQFRDDKNNEIEILDCCPKCYKKAVKKIKKLMKDNNHA